MGSVKGASPTSYAISKVINQEMSGDVVGEYRRASAGAMVRNLRACRRRIISDRPGFVAYGYLSPGKLGSSIPAVLAPHHLADILCHVDKYRVRWNRSSIINVFGQKFYLALTSGIGTTATHVFHIINMLMTKFGPRVNLPFACIPPTEANCLGDLEGVDMGAVYSKWYGCMLLA